jgi:hypothetical protein
MAPKYRWLPAESETRRELAALLQAAWAEKREEWRQGPSMHISPVQWHCTPLWACMTARTILPLLLDKAV